MLADPTNTAWGFWQKWADGTWEPDTHEQIDRYVDGGTFLDIGAWVGPTALWAAEKAGLVLAVEPDPNAYSALCANTREHPNIRPIQAAVWTETGTVTIESRGDSTSRVGGDTIVPAFTFSDLCKAAGVVLASVQLVKIDIEGAEVPVFEHSGSWLAGLGCPVLVSRHPWVRYPDGWPKGFRAEQTGQETWVLFPLGGSRER